MITVDDGAATPCLDDEAIALMVDGHLTPKEEAEARQHLDACEECRRLFAEAARASGVEDLRTTASATKRRKPVAIAKGSIFADKYRIESQLGRGGMGAVFAARHLALGQRVAIKVMLPDLLEDTDAVRRFAREARAAAALRSEHAVRIHDVGRSETGAPYLVMEYLDGKDLATILSENDRTPFPVEDAVRYMIEACDAIAEAHALGIVHRDIKPQNLFLNRDRNGRTAIKVVDFGLAKPLAESDVGGSGVTRTDVMLGSPAYMSPEQIRSSRDIDERADIWALGATLYTLVTGVAPFLGTTLHVICSLILKQDAPRATARRPDCPRELDEIIRCCLKREPDERFRSVDQLATALRGVLGRSDAEPTAVPSPAPQASSSAPLEPRTATVIMAPAPSLAPPRRSRLLPSVVGAAVAIAGAATAIAMRAQDAKPLPDESIVAPTPPPAPPAPTSPLTPSAAPSLVDPPPLEPAAGASALPRIAPRPPPRTTKPVPRPAHSATSPPPTEDPYARP